MVEIENINSLPNPNAVNLNAESKRLAPTSTTKPFPGTPSTANATNKAPSPIAVAASQASQNKESKEENKKMVATNANLSVEEAQEIAELRSQNGDLAPMINLQLFVYDNIGKAVKENISISSVGAQAMPLLSALKTRVEGALVGSDKEVTLKNIKELQYALESGKEDKVLSKLKEIYTNLIGTVQSRQIPPGNFTPAHIIVQQMRDDPFIKMATEGKNMINGWRVIMAEEPSVSSASTESTPSSQDVLYKASSMASTASVAPSMVSMATSSKITPSKTPAIAPVSGSSTNSQYAFSASTSGPAGGLGEELKKTGHGQITVSTLNVRTGDVGNNEPNKQHGWDYRKEGIMKLINGNAPLVGDINNKNGPFGGPSDLLYIQELDNKKIFADGLTQAQYVVKHLSPNLGTIPKLDKNFKAGDKKFEQALGKLIVYNKANLTATGNMSIRDLGKDPERFNKDGTVKDGQWVRQIIEQNFRINGTTGELLGGSAHGPHENDAIVKKCLEQSEKEAGNKPVIIGGDFNLTPIDNVKNMTPLTILPGLAGVPTKIGDWNDKDGDDFKEKKSTDIIYAGKNGVNLDPNVSKGVVYDNYRLDNNNNKVGLSDHRFVQTVIELDLPQLKV